MALNDKIDEYSIIRYDSENDAFICYGKYKNLEDAEKKAEELISQLEESRDWIEIDLNRGEHDELTV